jgi:hypothetical protein
MQALDRDPFGLDMLPEADMSEMDDEENVLAGDLPLPQLGCLHRIAQPDLSNTIPDAANLMGCARKPEGGSLSASFNWGTKHQ